MFFLLSDNFFDKDDNDAYSALIEDYFAESGDETETNTDNEEGMQCPHSLHHPMVKDTEIDVQTEPFEVSNSLYNQGGGAMKVMKMMKMNTLVQVIIIHTQ